MLTFDLKRRPVQKRPQYPQKRPADWACQAEDLAAFAKATLAAQAKPESAKIPSSRARDTRRRPACSFSGGPVGGKASTNRRQSCLKSVTDLRDRELGFRPASSHCGGGLPSIWRMKNSSRHNSTWAGTRPRRQILARLDSIPQKIPRARDCVLGPGDGPRPAADGAGGPRARETGKTTKAVRRAVANEQIAELIFQLRDQHGGYRARSETARTFFQRNRFRRESGTRLFKIGYEAVPQLIEALSDERFSRTLDFSSSRRRWQRAAVEFSLSRADRRRLRPANSRTPRLPRILQAIRTVS